MSSWASLDVDAAVIVAAAPLGDTGRRVGFVAQLEAGTLVAVLERGATRGGSVEMSDEGAAAGAVRWRRRIHVRSVALAYDPLAPRRGSRSALRAASSVVVEPDIAGEAMDGDTRWVGARIAWLMHSDDVDAEFAGLIDTAEDLGDGIVRLSGPLTSGHRFVLVTEHATLAGGSCSRFPVGEAGAAARPARGDDGRSG